MINPGDLAKVLNAPPGLPTAPSTEATLQLKPVLVRWRVAVRSLPAVEITICNPVGSHCFAWLGVEMRRDAEVNGVLGSGDLLDG